MDGVQHIELFSSFFFSFFGGCGSEEAGFCVLPVYDLPDLLHVVQADVFVVDVVGMLPDINGWIGNGILRSGVRPAGASISWLANSRILRHFEALS